MREGLLPIWNLRKKQCPVLDGFGPLKNEDGSIITEDIDMAEELNKFLTSVFTQEETTTVPVLEPETNNTFLNVEITKQKVKNTIGEIKENGAQGHD